MAQLTLSRTTFPLLVSVWRRSKRWKARSLTHTSTRRTHDDFFLVAPAPFVSSQLTKHALITDINSTPMTLHAGHVSLHVEHYRVLAKQLTHMQDVSWCALHEQGSSFTWLGHSPSQRRLQLPTCTHLHADHGRRSEDDHTHSVFYQLSTLGSPQAN